MLKSPALSKARADDLIRQNVGKVAGGQGFQIIIFEDTRGGRWDYDITRGQFQNLAPFLPASDLTDSSKPSRSSTSHWRLAGSQGAFYFVLIGKAQLKNESVYRAATTEVCKAKPVCLVRFWLEGADAPKSLPMTDKQVSGMIAAWSYNSNTGHQEMLWNCKMFPNYPKSQCLG